MKKAFRGQFDKYLDKGKQYANEQMNIMQNAGGSGNPCITITPHSTPDPYVIYKHGKFYLLWTAGDRIEIWSCHDLLEFNTQAQKHTIWRPEPDREYSADLWAPELHDIYGRWYVYFAGADPKHGNRSHRMFVLEGPSSDQDPCGQPWRMAGPINGLPNQWAIDGTVITLNNALYFAYSGWPLDKPGCENQQELWIIRLEMPTQANSQAVRLCCPDERWECSGDSGVNEGPQWLASPDGSWQGLVYSCAGSWTKDYKMNTLRYLGGDPLDPRSWRKGRPLLQNSPNGKGPYGPGHGNFVNLGNETVGVFHATDNPTDGWENRKARVQRLRWTQNGPDMGGCVGKLVHDKQAFLNGGRL